MLSCSVLPAVRKVYDQYGDLFAQCGLRYKSSTSLLSLSVLGSNTLSDLVRACPWSYSVSTLSRHVQKFKPNRFLRRLQQKILNKYGDKLNPDDFCFAVDDTANPKFGDMFRARPFYSSSGPYFGQKVLVVALVDIKRGFAIPLAYAFLTSTKDENHRPAPDVAVSLLRDLIAAGFPQLPVVTDSWFDSVSFMKNLKELGLEFCGEIKSKRLARTNPGPHVPWRKLPELFAEPSRSRLPTSRGQWRRRQKRGKAYAETIGYLKELGRPIKIIAVYNRINGINAFAYYATSDLLLSGAKLWQFSRARWRIECLFRDLKQNLSFGRLPCGGEPGADLVVCLPFVLISSIRLDGDAVWSDSAGQTVGKTIAIQRERALTDSIDLIVHAPNHLKVQRLKARRGNARSKPTDCGTKKIA